MRNVIIQNHEIFGQTIQQVNTVQHEINEMVYNGINDCQIQLQETENELMNSNNLLQVALAIEAEKYALWQAAIAELEAALASMDPGWIASATAQEEYTRVEYYNAVRHREDMQRRVAMAEQCVHMANARLEETRSVYTSYRSQLDETIHIQFGRLMQADERIKNYLSVNQPMASNVMNPEGDKLKDQNAKDEIDIKGCPLDGNGGHWEGERGNSKWIPDRNEIPKNPLTNPDGLSWGEILDKYGIDGIEFKDGKPNFSPISKGTVEINNFSENRYGKGGNFDQASEALAQQRGCTKEEIKQWMKDNKYTWHERSDCKTMDLVPTEVHGNVRHSGGISEIKSSQTTSL